MQQNIVFFHLFVSLQLVNIGKALIISLQHVMDICDDGAKFHSGLVNVLGCTINISILHSLEVL